MLCLTDNKDLKLTVEEQCVRHVENSGKVELNELFNSQQLEINIQFLLAVLKHSKKSQVMRIKKLSSCIEYCPDIKSANIAEFSSVSLVSVSMDTMCVSCCFQSS